MCSSSGGGRSSPSFRFELGLPLFLTFQCFLSSTGRFAVLILPTYVDPQDAESNPFRSTSTLAVHADPDLRAATAGEEEGGEDHLQGEGERKNSWRWFHTVNRVCSGVKKVRGSVGFGGVALFLFSFCTGPLTRPPARARVRVIPARQTLVLLYVVIPPLSSLPSEPDWVARHPAQALAKLEMREVVVRRFLPGRMRD